MYRHSSTSAIHNIKMKVIIALAVIIVVASAAVTPDSYKGAVIKEFQSDNIGVDGYKFKYETSDGVRRTEEAVLKNVGSENEALNVAGEVDWTDNEGKPHHLSYSAGEDGYKAVGSDVPQ